MSWKLMTKEEFDTDSDNIIDKSEGIPVVEELPISSSIGDQVIVDKKIYVRIE